VSDPSGFRRHTVGSPAGCFCVTRPRWAFNAENKVQRVTEGDNATGDGATTTFTYDGDLS
jgi:hypothetical protein